MTDRFQKNLQAMQTQRPDLYELVKQVKDVPALQLRDTAEGQHQLVLRFADGSEKPFYRNGSEQDAADDFQNTKFENARLVFSFGLGLGHHLLEFLKNKPQENRAIIVWEPFAQIFKFALQCNDFSELFKRPDVFFVVGDSLDHYQKFLRAFFARSPWLRFANAIAHFDLPGTIFLKPELHKVSHSILQQAIAYQYNLFFSDGFDAFRGLRHSLSNTTIMKQRPDLSALKDCLKGTPGAVLGSGPSLKDALPALDALAQKAFVISCPSTILALNEKTQAQVAWLNVERFGAHADYFANIKNHPVAFFGTPVIASETFERFQDNAVLVPTEIASGFLPLASKERFFLGHSNAHAAYVILRYLGCDPIYFIGMDLSYQGEETHTEGTWSLSKDSMKNVSDRIQNRHQVPGYDDNQVELNHFWWTYLQSFNHDLIPKWGGDVRHVLPKEHGARLKGAQRVLPQEFAAQVEALPLVSLAQLKACLAADSCLNEKLWSDQKSNIKDMLQKVKDLSLSKAIEFKEARFHHDLHLKNWQKVKLWYSDLLQDAEKFFQSFHHPELFEQANLFRSFFYPMMQGSMTKTFIEFYSSDADEKGDCSAIGKKLDLLFGLCQEQVFWAEACLAILKDEGCL